MQEAQRLAYLEAMGVNSYFPRLVLPGAKPSVSCPLPVARQSVAPAVEPVPSPTPVPASKPSGSARRALNLADMLGDVASKPSVRKPAEAVEPARAPAVAVERFSLRFVHSASGVLVIDSAPHPPSEKALLRFVAQVLFALTGKRDATLRCSPFQWPIADNPQLDHSEQAAREALHSSVGANIERDQVQLVLVMGETAQRYLPDAEGHWPQVSRLSLPDSQQVMNNGAEKIALWTALKTLEIPA